MLFNKHLCVDLLPVAEVGRIPFHRILDQWLQAKFNPDACRALIERLVAKGVLPKEHFRPSSIAEGSLVISRELLFNQPSPNWTLTFGNSPKNLYRQVMLESPKELQAVSHLLRWAFQSDDREAIRSRLHPFAGDLIDGLLDEAPESFGTQTFPIIDRPGIYRREHASLAIRSKTTSVVIDPITIQGIFPCIREIDVRTWNPAWDAVLVTHSHGDHWHLPSLLFNVPPEIPVIVPEVPRTNLLAPEDFQRSLSLVGQAAIVGNWGRTLTIGDIEIDVLPFYGEQPTRLQPGPESGVRNWGNCYRINTPDFSAVILVDTGEDPDGSMEDVLAESRKKRGPPDVIFSCLREFSSPFFTGLPVHWASLPFSRLRDLFEEYQQGILPLTTAGPEGVARVCKASGTKRFLPYAHGFAGLGTPISDIGWGFGTEPSEQEISQQLSRALKTAGAKTEVVSWNPGDSIHFGTSGEIELQPYSVSAETHRVGA